MKITEIVDFFKTSWYTKTGLGAAIVFVTIAGIGWHESLKQTTIGLFFIYLIIGLVWGWMRRPPRTSKHKIGFLVSISCADDTTSQQLQEDFIRPLRQLMKSGKTGYAFQFINLPQFLAREVEDVEQAEAMRIRTRANFMLYGNVRKRLIGGKSTHVIHLEGIVLYRSISELVNRDLATEFTELLPRRIHISGENDILAFQFTSEWTEIVVRYVLGIAFGLSGELDYSESLLNDSLQQLANKNQDFPIYRKLKERIPLRLSEICQARINWLYMEWMKTRVLDIWDDIEIRLKEVHPAHQNSPDMIYCEAMLHIVKYRDSRLPLTKMKKIGKDGDAVWHLNMAFLYAYNGNLRNAARHYNQAALIEIHPETIAQVESFMVWIIEQDPKQKHLFYCLGFFNWKIKGDEVQARKDFESFLELPLSEVFSKEKQLVQTWMSEM
ncbi:hypothetical protein SAMN05216403_102131 [Nitrosospira multiformis ATCC 25196]|uniref:Uncharacterized protein n=2 Tax=Nitrosospira multiformis TaxID=1231 RepID=A0A1H5SGQ5_NITMU|nr:hypothetical protein [Nitrosospira multiformis]SEF48937.1 hypothetical protein SAMN05216403_102131 [Nitrosospira multiformis ATCC 25196]